MVLPSLLPSMLANWRIGPSRARDLAAYAVARFDAAGLSGIEATTERDRILAEILTWEDEEVGPRNEAGIPYSELPKAKSLYLAAIDQLVDAAVLKLQAGGNLESEFDVEGFTRQAETLMVDYPAVIAPLRAAFLTQAIDYARIWGVEDGLRLLRSQLDSIVRAGRLQGGLSGQALRAVFGRKVTWRQR